MQRTGKKRGLRGSGKSEGDLRDSDLITIECVCPKCGRVHKLKLLWTGRGKPKKYCQTCKAFVATLEPVEFCGLPAAVEQSLEKAI